MTELIMEEPRNVRRGNLLGLLLLAIMLILASPFVLLLLLLPLLTVVDLVTDNPAASWVALAVATSAFIPLGLLALEAARVHLAGLARLEDQHLVLGRFLPVRVPYEAVEMIRIVAAEVGPGDGSFHEPASLEISWGRMHKRFHYTSRVPAFAEALHGRTPAAGLLHSDGRELPPARGWTPQALERRRVHHLRRARTFRATGGLIFVVGLIFATIVTLTYGDLSLVFALYPALWLAVATWMFRRGGKLVAIANADPRVEPAAR